MAVLQPGACHYGWRYLCGACIIVADACRQLTLTYTYSITAGRPQSAADDHLQPLWALNQQVSMHDDMRMIRGHAAPFVRHAIQCLLLHALILVHVVVDHMQLGTAQPKDFGSVTRAALAVSR